MIKNTSLKIFLSNVLTLTIKDGEKVMYKDKEVSLKDVLVIISECIIKKEEIIFEVELKNEYDKKTQKVKHYYHIPSDRISWYMIEEV